MQPPVTEPVLYGNIGSGQKGVDQAGTRQNMDGHLVISLLRMEEEASLRNGKRSRQVSLPPPAGAGPPGAQQVAPGSVYQNPDVVLNLHLLFTANYMDYGIALTRLSQLVAIFQHQAKLTAADVNFPNGAYKNKSLKFSLHSPSLEEWNNIWGMHGNVQLPAALYHVQSANIALIPETFKAAPPITEISLTDKPLLP